MLKINLFVTLLLTAFLGFGPRAWSQCTLSPANPAAQTVCQGTAITSLSFSSSGGTGAIFSGLPAGVSGSYNSLNGEITLSGTPSVAGTFNYFIDLVGCSGGTSANSSGVIVVSPFSAGSLSGNQSICSEGGGSPQSPNVNTTTFSSTVSGGTWSSSDNSVATVNSSTGVVTGISAGTATITYSLAFSSGGCSGSTATSSRTVTVTTAANAGSVNGTLTLCTGGSSSTSQLSSTVSGGVWSSSNTAIFTVNSTGLLTAVAPGTANVIYTVTGTGGCGIATTSRSVTVTSFTAGVLNGNQSICSVGGGSSQSPNVNTTTFASTVSGGTWSTSNALVATVSSSGVVTGVGAGTATITYSLAFSTGGCSGSTATSTRTVTVTSAPVAGTLSGDQAICIGGGNSTTQLSVSGNSVSGVWSSTNTTVVSVNSSGLVTAVGPGTANIVYTVTGTGGCGIATASRSVTVASFTAGVLNGNQSICSVGGGSSQSPNVNTTTFASTVSGGTWSTSNALVATVSSSGVVTGVGAGTATITYSLAFSTGGCSGSTATSTRTVTVTSAPVAGTISGNQSICLIGGSSQTQFSVSGNSQSGVWTSSNTAVATVSATGLVSAVGPGTANVTYTVNGIGGCGIAFVSRSVTVVPNRTLSLSSAPLSPNQIICEGSSILPITYSTTGATDALVSGLPNGVNGTWTASVLRISGTPSQTGTFNYAISLIGGCAGGTAQTASGTLVINPLNTVALTQGNSSISLCLNDSVGDGSSAVSPALVYTTIGASNGVLVRGLPRGMRAIYDSVARTTTINGIPSVRGVFLYRITALGGCTQNSSNTITGTITVNGNTILLGKKDANLSTPDVVTNIQTRCALRPIQPVVFTTTGATGASLVPALPANSGLTASFNLGTGVFTISGTPSGRFTYTGVVRMSGGCTSGQIEPSVNITVLDSNIITLTSGSGSENQTVPRNTAMTDITFSTAGATGARFRGLPSGVTGIWSANTVTISGTPGATGTYRYIVDLVGGCPVGKGNSDTGTITVTAGGTLIGGGNGEQGFEGDDANRSNQSNISAISSGRLNSNRGLITTVSVYPVPGSEFLYVRGLATLEQALLSIVDQTGRVVVAPHASISKDSGSSEYKLDLSSLADGMYFLHVQSATEGIDQMLRFSVKH